MLRVAVTGLTKAGSTRLCNLLRPFQDENVKLFGHIQTKKEMKNICLKIQM